MSKNALDFENPPSYSSHAGDWFIVHYCLAHKQCGFRTSFSQSDCKICHVTSTTWSRNGWLDGPKIRIVGLSSAELEMDETVHLKIYLLLSGRGKHQFQ